MEVVAPEPGGESDVGEPTRYSAGAPQMEVAAVDGGEEADDEAERPAYSRRTTEIDSTATSPVTGERSFEVPIGANASALLGNWCDCNASTGRCGRWPASTWVARRASPVDTSGTACKRCMR